MSRSPVFAVLVLGILVAAGCLGAVSEIPDEIQARGTQGLAIPDDWAYDGHGVTPIDGAVSIDVDNVANTGTLTAELTVDGETVEIRADHWDVDEPAWKDGGIVHGIMEHGDSGNGHAKIPASYSISAGWGVGEMIRDGETVIDPVTGGSNLTVHYMLFQGGVRDDDSRMILKEDRETPYEPLDPGNAHVDPNDRELHLVVKSQKKAPPDSTVTYNETVDDATYLERRQIPVAANGSALTVEISVQGPAGDTVPGELRFELGRPDRTLVDAGTAGGQDQNNSFVLEDPDAMAGNYSLDISGSAVRTRWTATAKISNPSSVFFHYLFEEVEILNVDDLQIAPPLE